MIKHRTYRWTPIPVAAAAKLERTLQAWHGTPYVERSRVRGGGADCVELVCGVLDDLQRGGDPAEVPRPPLAERDADGRLIDVEAIVIRRLCSVYDMRIVDDGTVEAGDVVVMRGEPVVQGVPALPQRGHCAIASNDEMIGLHAPEPQSPADWCELNTADVPIVQLYRPQQKGGW